MRIDPDRTVRRGRHVDYYWPGAIHTVWQPAWGEFRRERVFSDPDHTRLTGTRWQLQFVGRRRRVGFRYEIDH